MIKVRRVIFYSMLIFVFSIGIGYFYARLWKKENISNLKLDNSVSTNTVKETASVEEKVSYNASFALKKYYDKCGHLKFNYAELPTEIINLSKSELENMYPDWNIEKFSSNNIVLSKKIDDVCDDHYVLKLEDENIDVFHLANDEELEFFKSTGISTEYLTNEDIVNLQNGIYVYGISNLNSAIEDFE